MSKGISLINLGRLEKPATVLIEKVSDAFGWVFAPLQIIRFAKAQAVAEKIKAKSETEIAEMRQQVAQRLITEECQKQLNMAQIAAKAFPELKADSKPQDIENDWIVNFFDKCRLISDDQMQSLWAKILAGEANAPGRFSKRTVNFLITMDKRDAELFTVLCRFMWDLGDDRDVVMFGRHNDLGLTTDALKHLEQIGLIAYYPQGYNPKRIVTPIQCAYFGRKLFVKPKPKVGNVNPSNQLWMSSVNLSKIGHELAPLCETKPVDGVYDQFAQTQARFLDVTE